MPTSDERREVAERLRDAAVDDGHIDKPYGQQGFQVTLKRIIGTTNPNRPTLYRRLAGLIDPTCTVVSERIHTGGFGCEEAGYEFTLSCGHTVIVDGDFPPSYCDECGARVVDDDDDQ